MKLVLDASALMAYLKQEEGADLVGDLVTDHQCFAHALNLCEVYYLFRRVRGAKAADEALDELDRVGVLSRDEMDTDLWRQVGIFKCDFAPISIADCFCAALASRLDAEVVTADPHFSPLAEQGRCRVRFIR